MAFKHSGYTLYARTVTTKSGRENTVYFFAKRKPDNGKAADLPDGFDVTVEEHTGIPRLVRGTPGASAGTPPKDRAPAKKTPRGKPQGAGKKTPAKKSTRKKTATRKAPAKKATPRKKSAGKKTAKKSAKQVSPKKAARRRARVQARKSARRDRDDE